MAQSGQALDKDEIRRKVAAALNADSNDAEYEALFEIGEMAGVEWDDEKEEYK